jgi:hypothetical protein
VRTDTAGIGVAVKVKVNVKEKCANVALLSGGELVGQVILNRSVAC